MDGSMELVAKFCTEQLVKYMDCVTTYPNDWQKECNASKVELATCAQKSPAILRIKEACSAYFKPYETCLSRNPTDVQVCLPELEKFAACAEQVSSTPTPAKSPS